MGTSCSSMSCYMPPPVVSIVVLLQSFNAGTLRQRTRDRERERERHIYTPGSVGANLSSGWFGAQFFCSKFLLLFCGHSKLAGPEREGECERDILISTCLSFTLWVLVMTELRCTNFL